MSHRLQRYLDDIIKTAIPPDVFAREQRWESDGTKRISRRLDEQGKRYNAEQYAAAAQQFGNVTRTISEIAQETPITIKGILDGGIPPLLDPPNQRNEVLVDSLTCTIGLAAIKAYLDRNPQAVDELIPIVLPGEENSLVFSETEKKKDDVKWRLRNFMQDEGWDEEIKKRLQSATDASKESPPMPSGSSRKK